jgi:hypothetical protein
MKVTALRATTIPRICMRDMMPFARWADKDIVQSRRRETTAVDFRMLSIRVGDLRKAAMKRSALSRDDVKRAAQSSGQDTSFLPICCSSNERS